MTEFMFFIRKKSNSEDSLPAVKFEEFLRACESYIQNLKQQGVLLSAKPMDWTGKIISGKDNSWKETNYNDSGDVIGGYYHILANDLDEAVEIAKANPEFAYNSDTRIEIRPLNSEEAETGFVYPSETI